MNRTVVTIRTAQWSLYVPHSGHYMYRTVVTIYTVPPGLILNNPTFCPHSVFMCFVWISEQTAMISPYSINWLVFVTETESVYCAARTEYLHEIQVSFSPHSDLPCQYHSTNIPHSSSSTCHTYQKDKWARPGKLLKAALFRKLRTIG